LSVPAALHTEPDGVPLVALPAGAEVETGRAKGEWHQATVEGWIFTSSTEPTRRQGFDLVVTHDEGENLRSSPNGPVVGRAREGTLLKRVSQKGGWTHVRRAGWIPKKAIAPAKKAQGQAQQPARRTVAPTRSRGRRRPSPPSACRRHGKSPSAPRPAGARSGPCRAVPPRGSWRMRETG
jgi:hypothetical protein